MFVRSFRCQAEAERAIADFEALGRTERKSYEAAESQLAAEIDLKRAQAESARAEAEAERRRADEERQVYLRGSSWTLGP